MTIKIYDFDNEPSEVVIPNDKEISTIYVCILSGDETGIITFTDGSTIRFNASDCRMTDFYDGDYIVGGDNVQKWIDFDFSEYCGTRSYYRQRVFDV